MWNWKEKRQRNGIDNGQLRIDNSPRGKHESNPLRSTANWCLARSALPSPLGKVPQCAHWGGRGFRSGMTINTLEYMEKLRNAGFYQLQSEYLPCTKPLQSPKSVPKCRFGCQLPQRGSQGRCRASAVNNNFLPATLFSISLFEVIYGNL